MKSFMKKAVASLLVMALCLGGVSFQNQEAKAAGDYVTLFNEKMIATAGKATGGSFKVTAAGDLAIGVSVMEKCAFTYQLADSTGKTVTSGTVTSTDANWNVSASSILYLINAKVTPGEYSIALTFEQDQAAFALAGLLYPSTPPSLDSTSITVTKGFSDKVTVINAGNATVTYTSSNSKIASVDAKGNVKGKKKGTATITVKTSTGYTGTCRVTVKDNVYSRSKLSVGKAPASYVTPDVYKVSYDKKGNLIIKLRLINRFGRTAKQLKNFKVTIKNEKGKKIGVYSLKKKTINLRTGKAKALTCKIKKSKLKIKKTQDLRNMSNPSVKGKFSYSR